MCVRVCVCAGAEASVDDGSEFFGTDGEEEEGGEEETHTAGMEDDDDADDDMLHDM